MLSELFLSYIKHKRSYISMQITNLCRPCSTLCYSYLSNIHHILKTIMCQLGQVNNKSHRRLAMRPQGTLKCCHSERLRLTRNIHPAVTYLDCVHEMCLIKLVFLLLLLLHAMWLNSRKHLWNWENIWICPWAIKSSPGPDPIQASWCPGQLTGPTLALTHGLGHCSVGSILQKAEARCHLPGTWH